MARLLITNGVQQGRVLRLKPGVNRIGRSFENHFQVPDPSISASHCEVIFSESAILVRDLNSSNGTWIDGEPIQQGTMRIGQVLQLGTLELKLEDSSPVENAAVVNVPDVAMGQPKISTTLADGSLACLNHPELPATYRCTKCQEALCESCVRVVRRLSGGTMVFCSLCSGLCESLAAPPAEEPPLELPAGKGLFGRLSETLRIALKRR